MCLFICETGLGGGYQFPSHRVARKSQIPGQKSFNSGFKAPVLTQMEDENLFTELLFGSYKYNSCLGLCSSEGWKERQGILLLT